VRIDRLSNSTSYFVFGNWVLGGDQARDAKGVAAASASIELPPEELIKVTCTGKVEDHGWFKGELYNGSQWTITKIELVVGDIDAAKWFDVSAVSDDDLLRSAGIDVSTESGAKVPDPKDQAIVDCRAWMENQRVFQEAVGPILPLSAGEVLVNVGWHQEMWKVSKCFGVRN